MEDDGDGKTLASLSATKHPRKKQNARLIGIAKKGDEECGDENEE